MDYTFEYLPYFIKPELNPQFVGHTINAYDTDGNLAGYIKISYIPSGKFDKDIVEYLKLHGRIHCSWKYDERADLLYHSTWSLLNCVRGLSYAERNDELCKIEAMSVERGAKYIEDNYLDDIKARYQRQWDEDIAYHVNKPKVDFIRVEDNYRGSGLAEQLYIRAAKWMREEFGLPFRFSSLQSDQAKAVMNRMIKQKIIKVRKETFKTPVQTYEFNWIEA